MRFREWSIWQWPHWRTSLEIAERVIVIVGVGLAVFPLWQWYSEREERRIERVLNFAVAGEACRSHIPQGLPLFDPSLPSDYVSLTKPELMRNQSAAEHKFRMSVICFELSQYLSSDSKVEFFQSFRSQYIDLLRNRFGPLGQKEIENSPADSSGELRDEPEPTQQDQ